MRSMTTIRIIPFLKTSWPPLDELKPATLTQVPPEVTDWVLKVADLNQNGGLNYLELSRALTAFEAWWQKKVEYPPPPLAMYIKSSDMEALPPPPGTQSQCCVVS